MLPSAAHAAPKIQFDQTVHNFGKTSEVRSLRGSFTFHNAGNEMLALQKPDSSCDCAVVSLEPDTLAPGESGLIEFTLDVSRLQGRTLQRIGVSSNDPETPIVDLYIQADVSSPFVVIPQKASIGSILPGSTGTTTIVVSRIDGRPLKIVKAKTSNTNLTVAVESSSDKIAKLILHLAADGKPRQLQETISVFTDDTPSAALEIVVHSAVTASLSVEPQSLSWFITDADDWQEETIVSRRLKLRAASSVQRFEVAKMSATVPGMKFSMLPRQDPRTCDIIVTVSPTIQRSTNGTIRITTNLPEHPEITVPIQVLISAPVAK